MRENGGFEDAMVEVGVRGEEWGAGVGMLGVGVLDGEEAGGGGGGVGVGSGGGVSSCRDGILGVEVGVSRKVGS